MAFDRRFMDELLARSDIVDIVSGYVSLTRRGGEYWGCCPFHSEKTPSFHVRPEQQLYHCFGCKKGGTVIGFVMEIENLSYPDAVYFLAKRANLRVPEGERDEEAGRLRTRLLALNRDAARFYYEQLHAPPGEAVLRYLNERRITPRNAVNFGLGAAPAGWNHLEAAMREKGYREEELLAAGLVVRSKNGGVYDKFRNRLMFPIIDVRGDVLGFGGRAVDPEEKGAKYMNTPDTPVYSKRRVLYGLNRAKKSRRGGILLVEGNIDVVMLHQAGFDNACASMGTALTPEQLRLLARYTKELILCYDNDEAGAAATQKALNLLEGSAFTVRVLELPRRNVNGTLVKQDADDFIKYQGRDAFERLLTGSESGMDYRMARLAARFDLEEDRGRIAYAAAAAELLAGIPGPVERELYAGRAAEQAGLSAEAMRQEVRRARARLVKKERRARERRTWDPASALQPAARENRYENLRSARAEETILRILALDEALFSDEPPLRAEDFSSPLLASIYSALWAQRARDGKVEIHTLDGVLNADEMGCLTAILQRPESPERRAQALADCVAIVREEAGKRNRPPGDALTAAVEKHRGKGKQDGKRLEFAGA